MGSMSSDTAPNATQDVPASHADTDSPPSRAARYGEVAEDPHAESIMLQLETTALGAQPDQLPSLVRMVMREMGRRGGYARVSKGFGRMDPAKRRQAALRGLSRRWGRSFEELARVPQQEMPMEVEEDQ